MIVNKIITNNFNGFVKNKLYYLFSETPQAELNVFKYSEDITITITMGGANTNYAGVYFGNSRAISNVDITNSRFEINRLQRLSQSYTDLRLGWITVNATTGAITFHPIGTFTSDTTNNQYTIKLLKDTQILDGGLIVVERVTTSQTLYYPLLFDIDNNINYIMLSGSGEIATETITLDNELFVGPRSWGTITLNRLPETTNTNGSLNRTKTLIPSFFNSGFIGSYPSSFIWFI